MGNLLALLKTAPQQNRTAAAAAAAATTPAGNPLPSIIHKVVCQQELGPGRVVLVGDVHGCYEELQQLLQQVQLRHGYDNLMFVGDLVNKGPKSQQVVATVRQWCLQGFTWVVRGNHDDAALAARRQLDRQPGPLKPKYHWVDQMTPEDIHFLQELPFSLQVQGYNIAVVHAGMVPGRPLQEQQLKDLYKMRDVQPAASSSGWVALEKPVDGSKAWAGEWQGPSHVVFGHDAKRRLQQQPNATGLDTGCCYGGQLTACVLPALADLQLDADSPPDGGVSAQMVVVENVNGLQAIRGQLVSVQSHSVYEKPGRGSMEHSEGINN